MCLVAMASADFGMSAEGVLFAVLAEGVVGVLCGTAWVGWGVACARAGYLVLSETLSAAASA